VFIDVSYNETDRQHTVERKQPARMKLLPGYNHDTLNLPDRPTGFLL